MQSRFLTTAAVVLAIAAVAAQDGSASKDGGQLFQERCSTCHRATPAETERGSKAPALSELRGRQLLPEAVMRTTDAGGLMALPAQGLTVPERQRIAEWLTDRKLAAVVSMQTGQGSCTSAPPPIDAFRNRPHWDGWGVDGDNGRYQPPAGAGLGAPEVSRLQLKWAFGFPGAANAYSQPTVAADRVFVGGETGAVHALDARTGCRYWTYQADAAVRSAVVIGESRRTDRGALLFFGDIKANVYALDARSGALVWRQKVEDHPAGRVTASPALAGGTVLVPISGVGEEGSAGNAAYECCTFRGSVVALDAGTGTRSWKSYSIADLPRPTGRRPNGVQLHGPAGGSIWNTPTVDVDRGVVYVGTGNAFSKPVAETTDAVLAFSTKDGRLVWTRQLTAGDVSGGGAAYVDFDIGSSPILRKLPGGRSVVVVGQKSGDVYGLDPDRSGAVMWKTNLSKGGFWGGIEWGMAADDTQVYVPISDYPFVPPRSPPTTEAGSLIALRLDTGEMVWRQAGTITCQGSTKGECHPGKTAAISVTDDAVFAGSMDGYLRAYSTVDGRVLWEYNTIREYVTANGVAAKGGSLNGPGPAIAGGMLFVNSGYAYQGLAGNVLLAFAPE